MLGLPKGADQEERGGQGPINSTTAAPLVVYSIRFYSIIVYSTLLCSALLYSTLLYSTLLYSTLLYSTLLYSTLPRGPANNCNSNHSATNSNIVI